VTLLLWLRFVLLAGIAVVVGYYIWADVKDYD
jgi:hypothetical protein